LSGSSRHTRSGVRCLRIYSTASPILSFGAKRLACGLSTTSRNLVQTATSSV
jgi:hypothetical protein